MVEYHVERLCIQFWGRIESYFSWYTCSLKVSSKSISLFLFHLSSLYILSFWILLNYFKHLQEKKNILNFVMKTWKEMKKDGKCSWEIKSNSGVLLSLIATRVRSISLSHLLLNFFEFHFSRKYKMLSYIFLPKSTMRFW